MADLLRVRMSYDEWWALPEKPKSEWVDGEVVIMNTPPTFDHGSAERVTGLPPGPTDAQSLLLMRPPDLPEGPDRATALLGLLQVRGDRQGEGLGRAAHAALLDAVAGWPEIRTIWGFGSVWSVGLRVALALVR
jgi:hypothetical protein